MRLAHGAGDPTISRTAAAAGTRRGYDSHGQRRGAISCAASASLTRSLKRQRDLRPRQVGPHRRLEPPLQVDLPRAGRTADQVALDLLAIDAGQLAVDVGLDRGR